MEPCDREERALGRARMAYERAHLASALRGALVAAGLAALAFGLHQMSDAAWLCTAGLAAVLAAFGWRGGAWRRGALAGVLAGLPPLLAPTVVFAFAHGAHCPDCELGPTLPCLIACFGTSSLVGILVGHRATLDASPPRFGLGAVTAATLTGLLGCATTGLGGAAGIVIGLIAGSLTGWLVAGRTAHV